MNTILHTEWTIEDLCKGFTCNELEGEGLFGLDGRLTVQPEYRCRYIYNDGKRDVALIASLLKGCPIRFIYFNRTADGRFEVPDGQQRIPLSVGSLQENLPSRTERITCSISRDCPKNCSKR